MKTFRTIHFLISRFAPILIVTSLVAAEPQVPQPQVAVHATGKLEPTRQIVYKKIGEIELYLYIFEPVGLKAGDHRPAFVAFHGGGWTSGNPSSMYRVAAHYAELGHVGISAQYRLLKAAPENTVFDCVKDARSAIRYIRAHASELGIDPDKIIVSGASAGGHLAVASAFCDNTDNSGEDLSISAKPNALVLFSAVIDTSTEGYGNAKIGARWRDLSPLHQVRAGLPPTIVFHGGADPTVPIKGIRLFQEAMLRAGNRSQLIVVDDGNHGYMFKNPARYSEMLVQLDSFLAANGFLSKEAPEKTITKEQ